MNLNCRVSVRHIAENLETRLAFHIKEALITNDHLGPPTLLHTTSAPSAAGVEALVVPGSETLQDFVDAAAAAGLRAEPAIRLGLERGLVLLDLSRLGPKLDSFHRLLWAAARKARADVELAPTTAAWVRQLSMARPVPTVSVWSGISVRLSDRLLSRGGEVTARSLRAEAVPEMVAWEIAAALSGRTMGEWALWLTAES